MSITPFRLQRSYHLPESSADKLGWGQLFNQAILIILLLIFTGGGNAPYGTVAAQWTFRVSFGIMAAMTLWLGMCSLTHPAYVSLKNIDVRNIADRVAYFRYYRKVYSSAALKRSKRNARVNQSGYDIHSLKLVCSHFGGRVIGSTMGWLFNDFLFYGTFDIPFQSLTHIPTFDVFPCTERG